MSQIIVNDKFNEENKTLLMFTNKCLMTLNKFKSFVDLVFAKLKNNLDSNDSQNYEKLCEEIDDILRHKPNDIIIKNTDQIKRKSHKNIGQNPIKRKKLKTKAFSESENSSEQNMSEDNKVITQPLNDEKTYICDFIGCGKQYTKSGSYYRHRMVHKKKYICDFDGCDYRTHLFRSFNYHTNRHKGITPYKCDICGKGYPSKQSLKAHTLSAHDKISEQPLVCVIDNCNKLFKTEFKLNSHQKIYHLSEKRFSCDYPNCGAKYSRKQLLESHQIIHSNERPFTCPVKGCLKKFKTQMNCNLHLESMHLITESLYKCSLNGCDKQFKTERLLKSHTRNCHSGIKLDCDWPGCDFQTRIPWSLKDHKLVHSTEFKFKCSWPQCTKQFKKKIHLSEHIRVHKCDKRYACHWPGCQYRCVFNGNLKKHMRVHLK